MKPLNYRQISEILKNNGFVTSRKSGSHVIWINSSNGVIVSVPVHGKNKPMPIGTFLSIVKQSGISKDKFLKR